MIKAPRTGWLQISPHCIEHTCQVLQVLVWVTAIGLNVVVTEPSILCALRLSWPWEDRPSLISRLSFLWGWFFFKRSSQFTIHIPTRSLVGIYHLFQGPLTLISPGSVTRWPGRNIQLAALPSVNPAKPKPNFSSPLFLSTETPWNTSATLSLGSSYHLSHSPLPSRSYVEWMSLTSGTVNSMLLLQWR